MKNPSGSAQSSSILHTGDFRAIPDQLRHPSLLQRPIQTLFLDTTYLDPKYVFPPQALVLDAVQTLCRDLAGLGDERKGTSSVDPLVSPSTRTMLQRWLLGEKADSITKPTASPIPPKEKTLFLVGTYSIGKERVIKAVAHSLGSKVWASPEKRRTLDWLEDDSLSSLLTPDPTEASVHCCGMGDLKEDFLTEYLSAQSCKGPDYTRLVAFRPTGWTFSSSKTGTDETTDQVVLRPKRLNHKVWVYPVPYSEHSSFRELQGFIQSIHISKIIPTVGMNSPKSRERMNYWLDLWQGEKAKHGLSPLPETLTYW